jgi:hypothetical protein
VTPADVTPSDVTADPSASDALHERALGFVHAFEAGRPMPESFDALASDLARFQAAHVPGYARLCQARGASPAAFHRAADAPAVPTEAFKLSRVAAFPEPLTRATFRTSGTTLGARGAHAMRRPETYDAAALAFGRWALTAGTPQLPAPSPVLLLAPSPDEIADSSLSHMMQLFATAFGPAPAHATDYFIRDGVLELAALDARVAEALVANRPVLLLGTSFAFVHLLDAVGEAGFRLPPGSRVMQTGGFKGRSREVDAASLRSELAQAFAIDPRAIVSEYGMTELSSQFYEGTLRDASAKPGVYVEPPWARVVPVDPELLEPVGEGEEGIARIEDLMNVDSAFAVLAADSVRRVAGGFELLGRWPGAAPRGCSIAVDEILGAASQRS